MSTIALKSARGAGLFWIGIQSSWNTTVFVPAFATASSVSSIFPCGNARWAVHHTSGRLIVMPAPICGAWTVWLALKPFGNGFTGVACSPNTHVVGCVNAFSARRMRRIVASVPGSTSITRAGSAGENAASLSQNQQSPVSSSPSHTAQRNGQASGPFTAPVFTSLLHEAGE